MADHNLHYDWLPRWEFHDEDTGYVWEFGYFPGVYACLARYTHTKTDPDTEVDYELDPLQILHEWPECVPDPRKPNYLAENEPKRSVDLIRAAGFMVWACGYCFRVICGGIKGKIKEHVKGKGDDSNPYNGCSRRRLLEETWLLENPGKTPAIVPPYFVGFLGPGGTVPAVPPKPQYTQDDYNMFMKTDTGPDRWAKFREQGHKGVLRHKKGQAVVVPL